MSYVEELRAKIGHDEYIGVGAGVFVVRDKKVLLQRRRDNLYWSMHGGGLELGETVEEAAMRELREETGLIAGSMSLLGVFSGEELRHTYPNGDKVSIVAIIYVCEEFSGEVLPRTDETLELRWFDFDAIPENISPPDKPAFRAFAEYMRKKND